jgi:hypothetical protein
MIKYIFATLVFIALFGCNSVNPVWDTLKAATGLGEGKNARLSPGIEYLKVNVNGRQVMMALGYRTFPKPSSQLDQINSNKRNNGDAIVKNAQMYSADNYIHEYWYSGQREMLELVDGRIVSVMGMTSEWRQSNTTAPSWDFIASSNSPSSWVRNRDLMPGYRFGFKDRVTTRRIDAPKKSNEYSQNASWFQDVIESKNSDGSLWEYKQLFSLEDGKITYSEQCIASDLCLSMKYIGMIAQQ